MTVAPHPAAHPRSPSPPAASRNTGAMYTRRRQPYLDRGEPLAPAHRRHRNRQPSALPQKTPDHRWPPTHHSTAVAILKSP
jgi:hypothetical protein